MTETTASNDQKAFDLVSERNAEKRYAKQLTDAAKRMPKPRSFTGLVVPKAPDAPLGELVGRVALSGPDSAFLNDRRDFYIGERYANVDGTEVYSWTAPIACSFFRHGHSHDDYPEVGQLCDDVAVIRTFIRRNGQIEDFTDDVVGGTAPPDPFPKRKLTVPTPPPLLNPSSPGTAKRRAPGFGSSQFAVIAENSGSSRQSHPEPHERLTRDSLGLRAESALRAQLRAPRSRSLTSVLGTLQPDQYELVTTPAMDSFIIEGQPGTGKTIVASHRAAYLVHEETPPENTPDGKVLLVGPTPGYTRHVRSVVTRLSGRSNRIKVLSLPELMKVILKVDALPSGSASTTWQDVDWTLGRFARMAIARLKELNGVLPTPEEAYNLLQRNGVPGKPISQDSEWVRYLRELPAYKTALSSRAHAPLLAFIKWEVAAPADLQGIELIIVDEAQDVSELKWSLLHQMNEAHAWTILGDLNQRRSDHTPSDWRKVLDVLALDEDTPIRTLSNGYRSTKPILDFANRLSPRKERIAVAVQQDGPPPVIEKSEPKKLGALVLQHIERLLFTYPFGSIAVIGPDTSMVTRSMRATRWRTVSMNAHVWERDDREVTVVDADTARGVEFDAVVVLEPADFEKNFGRRGPLYTALTRANRELVVVHTKPLPRELRR